VEVNQLPPKPLKLDFNPYSDFRTISIFSSELGAAIHVGPNVTRVLQRRGFDEKRLRGVPCTAVRETFDFVFWTPLTFPDYSA
jgi:hypothetical protein